MSDKETKEVNDTTEKQEKVYLKEQETKNKNYKGPKVVDDTSSKGTKKDNDINSKDNNINKLDNCDCEEKVIEKTIYKDKSFYKYGFIISLILNIITIAYIFIKNIKNN